MSHSLVKTRMHIIFSTKNRHPFINHEIEDEVFAYISGTCKNLRCPAYKVGGHLDHIHILCNLSKTMTQSELVKGIKQVSSQWMKEKLSDPQFYWQIGYAAYSIDEKGIDEVTSYIENQRIHHQKRSFKEELRHLLLGNNMPFDEKYLWD